MIKTPEKSISTNMGQGSGADLVLQRRDFLDRSGDEGGSGVGDGLAAALAESGAADLERVHAELPISAPSHRNVGKVAGVAVGVGTAEDDLAWVRVSVSVRECEHA